MFDRRAGGYVYTSADQMCEMLFEKNKRTYSKTEKPIDCYFIEY